MRKILLPAVLFSLLMVNPGVCAVWGEEYAKQVQQYFAKSLNSVRTTAPAGPFCRVGFIPTPDNYVRYVEPKARAAGLQVGDRILAVEGTPCSTLAEDQQAIREHAPEERITLTVNRGGSNRNIVVTCHDGQVHQRLLEKIYQAGATGKWSDCLAGITEFEQLSGPAAWVASQRLQCNRAQRASDNRRPTYQDAALVYEARKRALEELHVVPNGVQQIKGDVLLVISWLRDNGFTSLSKDLERLLDISTDREAKQAGSEP